MPSSSYNKRTTCTTKCALNGLTMGKVADASVNKSKLLDSTSKKSCKMNYAALVRKYNY